MKTASTSVLDIAYKETGPANGRPVVSLHGFPDDIHVYDEVAPPLAAAGFRVIVPYLRGYGPTRFRDAGTPRSGQQAALGHDLLDLIDALDLKSPILAGYDWGGRAACVVSALWPERVGGLVSITGYNIQNIAASGRPQPPEAEYRYWYQWYFHTERGRAGLSQNRGPLCRLLWELWSPNYRFSDAEYALTAASFDNPDFVDVVIQSYRIDTEMRPAVPLTRPPKRNWRRGRRSASRRSCFMAKLMGSVLPAAQRAMPGISLAPTNAGLSRLRVISCRVKRPKRSSKPSRN